MTQNTEAQMPQDAEIDEIEAFAKAHPERCVELTPEWKANLLKNLEDKMQEDHPGLLDEINKK